MKGFRPGKEPAHLKKQRAKAQLPKDAGWAQKQTVDALAGRSPEEVRHMVRRWVAVLLVAAAVFAVGAFFLYGWAVAAGVAAHVFAGILLFLGMRLRRQGRVLEDVAKSMR